MMIKRIFDLIVSTVTAIALSPLFVVAAVAIKLDSPGPVLFRQVRVGFKGKPFHILKFRSMRANIPGPLVTAANDSRITRVGRVLRQYKIDELPQLFNVISGTMSLVGPRPEVQHYVDLWPDELRPLILSVRPGITDPVSVRLRHESNEFPLTDHEAHYETVVLPRKALDYAEYVRTRSFRGDLQVIVNTIGAVVND